jgi:hypothetical protein
VLTSAVGVFAHAAMAFSPPFDCAQDRLRQAQDRLRQQGRRRFFLVFLATSGQKHKKKKPFSALPEANPA